MGERTMWGRAGTVWVALVCAWAGVGCAGTSSNASGTASAGTKVETLLANASTSAPTSTATSTATSTTTAASSSAPATAPPVAQASASYLALFANRLDAPPMPPATVAWLSPTGGPGIQQLTPDLRLLDDDATVDIGTGGTYRADFSVALASPSQFDVAFVVDGTNVATYRSAGPSLSVSLMFAAQPDAKVSWQIDWAPPASGDPTMHPAADAVADPTSNWATFTLQRIA